MSENRETETQAVDSREGSGSPRSESKAVESGLQVARDDLLGTREWKRSKFGYLSGISSAARVVGDIVKGFSQSFGRVAMTFQMLMASDEVKSLPEISPERYDGKRRFKEAMAFHGMSEGKLRTARSNTRRSAYLYMAILASAVAYLAVSLLMRDTMPITTFALHLAPIPIFSALCIRALYYNWMFRHSTLEPISAFLSSKDWLPR